LYAACVTMLLMLKLRLYGVMPEEEDLLKRLPLPWLSARTSGVRYVYVSERPTGAPGDGP
jgi:hypothetical protein